MGVAGHHRDRPDQGIRLGDTRHVDRPARDELIRAARRGGAAGGGRTPETAAESRRPMRARRRRRRRRPRQRTRRRLSRTRKIGNRLSTPCLRPQVRAAPVAPALAQRTLTVPLRHRRRPCTGARAPRFIARFSTSSADPAHPPSRRRAPSRSRWRTACRPVHAARERRRPARASGDATPAPTDEPAPEAAGDASLPRRSRRARTPRPPRAQIGPQPTSRRSFWRPRRAPPSR